MISDERREVIKAQTHEVIDDLLALEQRWADRGVSTNVAVGAISSWFARLCFRHGIAFAPVSDRIGEAYRFAIESRCLDLLTRIDSLRPCVDCAWADGTHESGCEMNKLISELRAAKNLRDRIASAAADEDPNKRGGEA